MSTNSDIFYNIEIDSSSPRCIQPKNIKKNLKPHQLPCIEKENDNCENIRISTNVGILGDIVGYGKTLTALSIVAHNPLNNIHVNNIMVNSYHSNKAYNYFTAVSDNKKTPKINNMVNSTLIIVPRGPVYVQWEKTLKESTSLKYLAIDSLTFIKKNLPEYDLNN